MKLINEVVLIIIISSLLNVNCKPNEQKNSWAYKVGPYKHTIIPEELFGINFCKIDFIEIVKDLQNKHINFKYYKPMSDNMVMYTGEIIDFKKIDAIETNYFIGSELDKTKIIKVIYEGFYYEKGWIRIKIKFKEDYFDTLLNLLGNKLGTNNINYNQNKYGETSWDADSNYKVPTCISDITISKKLRYDDDKKGERGFCYLEINTRPPAGSVP